MAIKALSGFAPYWYTPKSQIKDPDPTRFKVHKLNGEQMGNVRPELSFNALGDMDITGRGLTLTLIYGLDDWENFCDDQGPVKAVLENHCLIHVADRVELATEIIKASTLGEESRKNS